MQPGQREPISPLSLRKLQSSLDEVLLMKSLPISYEDAIPILNALKGHGTPAGEISEDWVGGLGFYGVEYFTGPSEVELHFVNEVNTRVMPIWSECPLH